jgi:hypothetical protein
MVLDDLEFALKILQQTENIQSLAIIINSPVLRLSFTDILRRFEMIRIAPRAKDLSLQLHGNVSRIGPTELDLLWTYWPEITKLHVDIRGNFSGTTFRPCQLPSLKELHIWTWQQLSIGLGSPIETLVISYLTSDVLETPPSMDLMKKMFAALSPTLLRLDVVVWGRTSSTSAMVFLLEQCPNIEWVNFRSRSVVNIPLLERAKCVSIVKALSRVPRLKYLGILDHIMPRDFQEFSAQCFDAAPNLELITFSDDTLPISRQR